MALKVFKAFLSTVTPFKPAGIFAQRRVLTDPTTGAPVGIQNDNANGPDGRWVPVDVTAAQIAAPSAAMLADLDATYRLNVYPYTRYRSTGQELTTLDPGETNVIPADGPFSTVILYSPVVISDPQGLVVQGTAYVRSVPA